MMMPSPPGLISKSTSKLGFQLFTVHMFPAASTRQLVCRIIGAKLGGAFLPYSGVPSCSSTWLPADGTVYPALGESASPVLECGGQAAVLTPHSFESLPVLKLLPGAKGPKLATQTLSSPSTDVPQGPSIPPPVNMPSILPSGATAYTMLWVCEATHALPRESTEIPLSPSPNGLSRNFCLIKPFTNSYFARLFGDCSPLVIHTVLSGARAAPKGPLKGYCWNLLAWWGSPPGNTNTLPFP